MTRVIWRQYRVTAAIAGAILAAFAALLLITGGVFLAIRLAVTYGVRVHYIPAVTTIYSVTENFTPKGAFWPLTGGVVLPGGHLSTGLSVGPGYIISSPGASAVPASCQQLEAQISSTLACMARLGYHSFTTYQPGYRFWPFQLIETGIFVALAAALIAVTFLVVRRRDA
jgi:hypothetical protein